MSPRSLKTAKKEKKLERVKGQKESKFEHLWVRTKTNEEEGKHEKDEYNWWQKKQYESAILTQMETNY